jgi:hypothetical protein
MELFTSKLGIGFGIQRLRPNAYDLISPMASEQQVKRYLAYWFQLGKRVVIRNGQSARLPQPIMAGEDYSEEFESLWQQLLSPDSGDCYLEGTEETIAELLTPQWQLESCSRCDMPIPMRTVGMPAVACPCCDLSTWPNTELPLPRSPICSQRRLCDIRERLQQANNNRNGTDNGSSLAEVQASCEVDTELHLPCQAVSPATENR